MARARPPQESTFTQDDDREDAPPPPAEKAGESVVSLSPIPALDALHRGEEGLTRLADPRVVVAQVKGDATAKNRSPTIDGLVTARALGGESFRRLERELEKRKHAVLEAESDDALPALQKAYKAAKQALDEAIEKYAAEAAKKATVRRYRVMNAKLVTTPGSVGMTKMWVGKEIDSLNFDPADLRRQGVKLEEIHPEDEAN